MTNNSPETEKPKRRPPRMWLKFVVGSIMGLVGGYFVLQANFETEPGPNVAQYSLGVPLLFSLEVLVFLLAGFLLSLICGVLFGVIFGQEFRFRSILLIDLVFMVLFFLIINFGHVRGLAGYPSLLEFSVAYAIVFGVGFIIGWLPGIGLRKVFSPK